MTIVKMDIHLAQNENGHVIMDGQDLTGKVVGLTVSAEPRYPPVVTLAFLADLTMTGDVEINQYIPQNETLAKLRDLDPKEIEREALARQAWGDSMVSSVIKIIVEKVT